MIDGWWRGVRRLLDMGISLSCTTNSATPLSPDEVATFGRFKYIELSIDTHDIDLLKKVRKKVDARTIVHNFHLIRAYCLRHGVPTPEIVWTGVLTRHIVETLPDFVTFAAFNGVKTVNFNEVSIYEGAPEKGLNIIDLDGAEFERAADLVEETVALAGRFGIKMSIAELVRIRTKREALRIGAPFGEPLIKRSTPIEEHYGHNEVNAIPSGHTRACTSPWTEFYLDPKGQVFSCCARGEVMGIARTQKTLERVLSNEKYRELRRALATGQNLDSACASCTVRPVIPVGLLPPSPPRQGILRRKIGHLRRKVGRGLDGVFGRNWRRLLPGPS